MERNGYWTRGGGLEEDTPGGYFAGDGSTLSLDEVSVSKPSNSASGGHGSHLSRTIHNPVFHTSTRAMASRVRILARM